MPNRRKTTRRPNNKPSVEGAKKVNNTEELIKLCKKLMTLCNSSPYNDMEPKTRYQELYEIYKTFAQSHPVVYKMITEEKKYSSLAFTKYIMKYNKTIITPDKQPELGAYYLMQLEIHRNRGKRINMKDFYRYKGECEEQMKNDLDRVKEIEKEEAEKYEKKEEERLEQNRQELFDFFSKLNELKNKVDEFKSNYNEADNVDESSLAASSS